MLFGIFHHNPDPRKKMQRPGQKVLFLTGHAGAIREEANRARWLKIFKQRVVRQIGHMRDARQGSGSPRMLNPESKSGTLLSGSRAHPAPPLPGNFTSRGCCHKVGHVF